MKEHNEFMEKLYSDKTLWRGKYKMRMNYDRGVWEASIAGVWVLLETIEEPDFNEEEVAKIYGQEVVDELSEVKCNHLYVWDGNTMNKHMFKCHNCNDVRMM